MAKTCFKTTISLFRHRALICLYVWVSYCMKNQPVMSMPVASTNLQCNTANKNPCQLFPDLCLAGGGLCVVKAPCEYQCICPPDGRVARDCTSDTILEPGLVVDSLVIFPPDLFWDINSAPKAEALTAPSGQVETGKEITVTTTSSSVSDTNRSPITEALVALSSQSHTEKETTIETTPSSVTDMNSSSKAEALVALSSQSHTEKETTIETTPSSVTDMNSSPKAEALTVQSAHLETEKETTLTTLSSASDTNSSLKADALTIASSSVATTNVTAAASNTELPHPVRSRLHKKEVISPQEETSFTISPAITTVIEDYETSENNNSSST